MSWYVIREGAPLEHAPEFPSEAVALAYLRTLPAGTHAVAVHLDDPETDQ